MNHYETILIFHPDLSDEALDQVVETVQERLKSGGAEIVETEHWGKRRLAYAVRRERYGHYVLLRHHAPTHRIREFENYLKISEPVLKYLTVRIQPGAVTPADLLKERGRSADGDSAEEVSAPPAAAPARQEEETGQAEASGPEAEQTEEPEERTEE